jgi:outer membrane autotransporter protein
MAGWRHAFDEVTPFAAHAFAGGSAFTVAGAPIAPDAFVLDLGASVELTRGAMLGVSYGGQFGSGFTDHGVKANLAVRF